MDTRPSTIRNYKDLMNEDNAHYEGSDGLPDLLRIKNDQFIK